MSTFIETLRLIRIINCIMAMAAVWIGARMTWLMPVYYPPAIAGLAAFLICAAGNAVNDLVDVDIDRINRPNRVLVRGVLSRRYVFVLAAVLNLLALAMMPAVNREVTIAAAVAIGMLYLYNYWLKKIPLAGNFAVSLLAGLAFVTGGLAIDPVMTWYLPGPLIAAVFAVLFHLVRELVKDVADIEGDRAAGIKTVPQVIGEQRTLTWVLVIFIVLVLVTLLPVLLGWFSVWYKIIAIYVLDLPLMVFLIFLWGNPSKGMLRVGSAVLKVGMAVGFVALAVA